ncbi:MAG: hypothetical protein LBE16_06890, partial [Clostridiales Family XIII bacterium]|nr:hypothetical protein [Clostridiales Family XIII bacterium]
MRDDLRKEIQIPFAGKPRGRISSAALRLAGLIVVLIVFYALSLPALTAEDDPVCNLQEHTHTDA